MGLWDKLQLVLVEPTKTVVVQIQQFLANIITVLLILLVGWLLSKLLKYLVVKLCGFIQFDRISERIELDDLLKKVGLHLDRRFL